MDDVKGNINPYVDLLFKARIYFVLCFIVG